MTNKEHRVSMPSDSLGKMIDKLAKLEEVKEHLKKFPHRYGGITRKEKMGYMSYDWYVEGEIQAWVDELKMIVDIEQR